MVLAVPQDSAPPWGLVYRLWWADEEWGPSGVGTYRQPVWEKCGQQMRCGGQKWVGQACTLASHLPQAILALTSTPSCLCFCLGLCSLEVTVAFTLTVRAASVTWPGAQVGDDVWSHRGKCTWSSNRISLTRSTINPLRDLEQVTPLCRFCLNEHSPWNYCY